MRILLVETDEQLLSQLQTELTRQNFLVDVASDGEIAWGLLHSFAYDLLLVEVSRSKIDGISLCRRLREVGNPLLVILIIDPINLSDRLQGWNSGADDCLMKPIDELELLARIRALARRGLRRASPVLSWGPLRLDPISRQVTCLGQVLKISRKEYLLLELFLSHPRQMFTRSEIADRLWTLDEELPTDATIKSHIRSIRRKLEQAGGDSLIETRYGHGYRLNPLFDIGAVLLHSRTPNPDPLMDSITANIWYELMAANARLHEEIDERKNVEAQLRRSELLLRNAQRAAHIGCWEFDFGTGERYWTEELYHIHGLDPDRAAPKRDELLTLIHPDDRQIHEIAIVTPALKGQSFEVNLRILRSDGEIRLINTRGGPIFNEAGELVKLTGTTFDVTYWET